MHERYTWANPRWNRRWRHRRVFWAGPLIEYWRGRATVWARSTFERHAFVTVTDDLNRSPARLHNLAPCSRKPGMDEAGNHVAIEPVASTSRSSATPCGMLPSSSKRTALFRTEEVTCSRQLRQQGPHRIFSKRCRISAGDDPVFTDCPGTDRDFALVG